MPVAPVSSYQKQFDLLLPNNCPSPEVEKCQVPKNELVEEKACSLPFIETEEETPKSVRFFQKVTIRLIPDADDLSDEEYKAVWYRKHEFRRIRQEFQPTVTELTYGVYSGDDDEQCKRGLEYRTQEGARRRKTNKKNARIAVLEEQDRQRSLGIVDPVALRKASVAESYFCSEEASAFGTADAEDAALAHFSAR
mmetsp:Transcript_13784/g.32067  ORF Transcript_13784/g.32067 Transcript_13784/m.32067 type:complete len:195 (+) Transcript_13784:83-667(+)